MTTLPRLFRTASFRLAAAFALIFAVSALILGGVVYWTTHAALEQQMNSRIMADLDRLRGEFQAGGQAQLAAEVRRTAGRPGALHELVADAGGAILAGDMTTVPQPGWSTIEPHRMPSDESELVGIRTLTVRLPDGTLLAVGDDLEWIEDADEAIFHAFSVAVLVTLGLGIAGGALLSVAFLQRVDAISRTAEAIIAGDLASRIPVRGTGDDLDRLSNTLNHMLGRIADLMEGLRQVSNDIAHDLRTPLARLRQRLERVRATAASADDYAVAVDAALAETDTLLETFAALLRIAQIEGGARPPVRDPVELHAIVETVVEAFTPSAEEDGKVLVSPRLDPAVVAGDRELLTQMLVNLVENAIRHTPAGTRIEVDLTAGSGVVRLTIADDGPGVPAEERGRIFRRFYRLERSRTTDGSGLGLSLVKAIADRHEATVSVSDNRPGLRVSLDFNRHDGASAQPAGGGHPVTAQHSR